MRHSLNQSLPPLTVDDCRVYGIPVWWVGKPMNLVRFFTIEVNLK